MAHSQTRGARPGTFSIVARDPEADAVGVAISTALVGVGAVCPHVGPNGAVSVQSFSTASQGEQILDYLDDGVSLPTAISAVLADDPHSSYRQFHGVDADGETHTFTGDDCVGWHGAVEGGDYTVAGNMLAGVDVLTAMGDAFEAADGRLSERLLAALEAGQGEGGDKRGKVSAALLVHAPSSKLYHNLRVDYADHPVARLAETYERAVEAEAEMDAAFTELLGDFPDDLLEFGSKY